MGSGLGVGVASWAVRSSGGGSGGVGGGGSGLVSDFASVLGAGGGMGAGLASFSPFMIWLSWVWETVSTGIASWLSSNLRADANPRIRSNTRAPWSVLETAQAQYDRRSSNAAPGY